MSRFAAKQCCRASPSFWSVFWKWAAIVFGWWTGWGTCYDMQSLPGIHACWTPRNGAFASAGLGPVYSGENRVLLVLALHQSLAAVLLIVFSPQGFQCHWTRCVGQTPPSCLPWIWALLIPLGKYKTKLIKRTSVQCGPHQGVHGPEHGHRRAMCWHVLTSISNLSHASSWLSAPLAGPCASSRASPAISSCLMPSKYLSGPSGPRVLAIWEDVDGKWWEDVEEIKKTEDHYRKWKMIETKKPKQLEGFIDLNV